MKISSNSGYWYSCISDEWVFCRFFTYLYRVDRGLSASIRGIDKSSLKKGIITFFIMMIIGYAGYYFFSSFNPWHNIFAVFPILAFPVFWIRIFYFDQLKHDRKLKQASRKVVSQEQVPYIYVNQEGIGVNLLGNSDLELLPFIQWDSLKKIELHYTSHPFYIGAPENKFGFRERMAVYFEEMRNEYPNFEGQPQDEYEDRYSLLLTHNAGNLTQISIPSSWTGTGDLKKIIESIEKISGMKVKPYPYLGEKKEKISAAYDQLFSSV